MRRKVTMVMPQNAQGLSEGRWELKPYSIERRVVARERHRDCQLQRPTAALQRKTSSKTIRSTLVAGA